MTEHFLARRHLLALAALATTPAAAAPARSGDLLTKFADQDSRLDGAPVFWLTRGREYGIQDGAVTPIYDRHVIAASRTIRQPDGSLKRPYVETAFATMPGETDVPDHLTSPFTGGLYPQPRIKPLRLTLWISPTGKITQQVRLGPVSSTYEGTLSEVHNPAGPPLLSSTISVHGTTPAGPLALTEMGPYQSEPAKSAHGFTPASREIIVFRAVPAALLPAGGSATMLGIHPAQKFASIADVTRALTPTERSQYASWLASWERLLNATADVIIGA
jgi:hypothetical protein